MFSFNKNKFLFLEVLLSIYVWPNFSLKNKISQIKAGPNGIYRNSLFEGSFIIII
jgi:hypothetical protein